MPLPDRMVSALAVAMSQECVSRFAESKDGEVTNGWPP